MDCYNFRWNHHLSLYGAYKQSLEAEKRIDIEFQIEKLQRNGVTWSKVGLRSCNLFCCIYLLLRLISIQFTDHFFEDSTWSVVRLPKAADAHVHFCVFSQTERTKSHFRNESKLLAFGHRTTINVFGTRHHYRQCRRYSNECPKQSQVSAAFVFINSSKLDQFSCFMSFRHFQILSVLFE